MAILSKGTDFSSGDQVTATNLDAHVDNATFVSGSSGTTDDSSLEVNGSGRLQVKDGGITAGKLGSGAITTAKLSNSTSTTTGVTFPKLRYMKNLSVIGNVSGASSAPTEVDILDEDDMASDSATSLVTQQSVKAYAVTAAQDNAMQYSGTEVLSGSLATSYTDLDLSSVVGTNRALVHMRAFLDDRIELFCRTNGDTADIATRNGITGCGVGSGSANEAGYFTLITDASGVIEYKADAAGNGASTLTVQCFQVLR